MRSIVLTKLTADLSLASNGGVTFRPLLHTYTKSPFYPTRTTPTAHRIIETLLFLDYCEQTSHSFRKHLSYSKISLNLCQNFIKTLNKRTDMCEVSRGDHLSDKEKKISKDLRVAPSTLKQKWVPNYNNRHKRRKK